MSTTGKLIFNKKGKIEMEKLKNRVEESKIWLHLNYVRVITVLLCLLFLCQVRIFSLESEIHTCYADQGKNQIYEELSKIK